MVTEERELWEARAILIQKQLVVDYRYYDWRFTESNIHTQSVTAIERWVRNYTHWRSRAGTDTSFNARTVGKWQLQCNPGAEAFFVGGRYLFYPDYRAIHVTNLETGLTHTTPISSGCDLTNTIFYYNQMSQTVTAVRSEPWCNQT